MNASEPKVNQRETKLLFIFFRERELLLILMTIKTFETCNELLMNGLNSSTLDAYSGATIRLFHPILIKIPLHSTADLMSKEQKDSAKHLQNKVSH